MRLLRKTEFSYDASCFPFQKGEWFAITLSDSSFLGHIVDFPSHISRHQITSRMFTMFPTYLESFTLELRGRIALSKFARFFYIGYERKNLKMVET
jgi:hypothetical protein